MTPAISALLKALLLPPGINLLVILVALVLLKSYRTTAYLLLSVSLVTLLIFSLPITALSLAGSIEPDSAFTPQPITEPAGRAIVVLGCGRYARPPEYAQDDVSPCALTRLRYTAHIQATLNLPILITGGSVFGATVAESVIMRRVLQDRFKLVVDWLETESVNTIENARLSAPLLKEQNITTVYLVTHAMHMRRASRLFEQQGFDVIPAPTYFHSAPEYWPGWMNYLPSPYALTTCHMVLKEYLGILWQTLTV
ncbi:MAG: YdcF family protein [Thiotrichales bacterium]|nr:YdcF family protein [Thiotrichales bacterium]